MSAYSFLKPVKTQFVWLLSFGVAISGLFAFWGAENIYHLEYETCAVCGYQAINKNKTEEGCGYCFSDTWAEALSYETTTKYSDWLRNEQFQWFGGETPEDTFDFFHPLEDDGFKKDTSWRPLLTEQDLIDSFITHLRDSSTMKRIDSLPHSKNVY